MKRKSWPQHLLAGLFSFVFSLCAVGCLVTGWDLSADSFGWLVFWCVLFSAVPAVLLYFRYGWCGILLLSLRGAFALWQDGALWEQLQSFACTVSQKYNRVYGWPTVGTPGTSDCTLVLILLAFLTALTVCLCICLRLHSVFALPILLFPLVICLLAPNALPDTPWLYLLMLGILLLLLTDWVRRKNPPQFAAHTLRVLVPAAAALGLLFLLNPQAAYVNRAAELQKKVTDWAQQAQSAAEDIVSENITGSFAFQKLQLRTVGPRSGFTYNVMHVTSSYSGTVYLRGRDYNIYTGTAWESAVGRSEVFSAGTGERGTLTVRTSGVSNVLYLPCYPAEAASFTDGYVKNRERQKEYTVTAAQNPGRADADLTGYTDLPPQTRQWAGARAAEILRGQTEIPAQIRSIAEYVRRSAEYDLATAAMDPAAGDFARWFLEESDTGYCVHFATAAAVLLRAAGIPARYVEGYMIRCRAGETVTVTNQEAHAWVEYYDYTAGAWRILEATPADADAPAETEEPEETLPAESDSDTETSVPDPPGPPDTEPEPPASPEDTDPTENPPDTSPSSGIPGVGTGGRPGTPGQNPPGSGTGTVSKEPFRLPEWVVPLLWILLAAAAVPAQGEIRIAVKRRRWRSGAPNRLALIRFRQSLRESRLTKTEMPAALTALAQKAKFSQHTLTEEELEAFTVFRRQILSTVSRMSPFRKAFFRWILAIG